MTFLALCVIDPSKLSIFTELRAQHYAFLIANRETILFGGPTRVREDSPPETMAIVFHARTIEDAEGWIAGEPYNQAGGFSTVTVRHWSQVLPETTPGALERTRLTALR